MENTCFQRYPDGTPKSCTYSKAMNQPYPRKCVVCGQPEPVEEPKIVFEQPKPQYFVRNLKTGKFAKKYSGGNSWASLGLAMNRLRQLSRNGDGYQIEKYEFGQAEIIDPKSQIMDAKILLAAKTQWEHDRRRAINVALSNLRDFTGLHLDIDGYRKLLDGDLITLDKKVEIRNLIDIYLDAQQMKYTEDVKTEYIKKVKNETQQ